MSGLTEGDRLSGEGKLSWSRLQETPGDVSMSSCESMRISVIKININKIDLINYTISI